MDDAIPEKLVSDIMRIYGYDKIPMTNVTAVVTAKKRAPVPTYDGVKIFSPQYKNRQSNFGLYGHR
jgi:phenylalanyl-tRNA synthetase beta subunit